MIALIDEQFVIGAAVPAQACARTFDDMLIEIHAVVVMAVQQLARWRVRIVVRTQSVVRCRRQSSFFLFATNILGIPANLRLQKMWSILLF